MSVRTRSLNVNAIYFLPSFTSGGYCDVPCPEEPLPDELLVLVDDPPLLLLDDVLEEPLPDELLVLVDDPPLLLLDDVEVLLDDPPLLLLDDVEPHPIATFS